MCLIKNILRRAVERFQSFRSLVKMGPCLGVSQHHISYNLEAHRYKLWTALSWHERLDLKLSTKC